MIFSYKMINLYLRGKMKNRQQPFTTPAKIYSLQASEKIRCYLLKMKEVPTSLNSSLVTPYKENK